MLRGCGRPSAFYYLQPQGSASENCDGECGIIYVPQCLNLATFSRTLLLIRATFLNARSPQVTSLTTPGTPRDCKTPSTSCIFPNKTSCRCAACWTSSESDCACWGSLDQALLHTVMPRFSALWRLYFMLETSILTRSRPRVETRYILKCIWVLGDFVWRVAHWDTQGPPSLFTGLSTSWELNMAVWF